MPRILLVLVQLLVITTGCSLQTPKAEANLIEECTGPACVVVARPAPWPAAQQPGLKVKVANFLTLTVPEPVGELTKVGDGMLLSWPDNQSLLVTDVHLVDMLETTDTDLGMPAVMHDVFINPADQLTSCERRRAHNRRLHSGIWFSA